MVAQVNLHFLILIFHITHNFIFHIYFIFNTFKKNVQHNSYNIMIASMYEIQHERGLMVYTINIGSLV